MKFHLRHPLPADAETAWNIVMSDEFAAASYEHSGSKREVLSTEERDGKIYSSLRITLQSSLPPMAAKMVGSSQLSWIQDQITDNSRRQMQWRIQIPGVDKVKATGSFSIVTEGSTCIRVVEGDVQVSIPLVGRKAEKHVCKQLEQSYNKTAIFTQQWLQRHKDGSKSS